MANLYPIIPIHRLNQLIYNFTRHNRRLLLLLLRSSNFSPTKVGGLFSGVKSQVSGWLPTVSMPTMSMPTMPAMPSIPGLRKHQEDGAAIPEEEAVAAQEASAGADDGATGADDEDKSRYHGVRYVGAKQLLLSKCPRKLKRVASGGHVLILNFNINRVHFLLRKWKRMDLHGLRCDTVAEGRCWGFGGGDACWRSYIYYF